MTSVRDSCLPITDMWRRRALLCGKVSRKKWLCECSNPGPRGCGKVAAATSPTLATTPRRGWVRSADVCHSRVPAGPSPASRPAGGRVGGAARGVGAVSASHHLQTRSAEPPSATAPSAECDRPFSRRKPASRAAEASRRRPASSTSEGKSASRRHSLRAKRFPGGGAFEVSRTGLSAGLCERVCGQRPTASSTGPRVCSSVIVWLSRLRAWRLRPALPCGRRSKWVCLWSLFRPTWALPVYLTCH